MTTIDRRGFLSASAATAASAGLAGVAASAATGRSPATVPASAAPPFHGVHQQGILTPPAAAA